MLPQSPDNPRLVQIVGRHFHLYAVADDEANEAFTHLAGDGGEDLVFIVELDLEHGSRQDGQDAAFHLDMLFHKEIKSGVRFNQTPP